MERRVYALYDDRALGGRGTTGASLITIKETEQSARDSAAKQFQQVACYSYERVGMQYLNEKWEWDFG